MAGFIQYIPQLMQAGGTFMSGRSSQKADAANAAALDAQAFHARSQAGRDEEALRRESRIKIGRQAAASAESGIGLTGSAGLLLEQSDILSELDALNIRYGGRMKGQALKANARAIRAGSSSGYGLLAGAQLLSGVSRTYTNQRTTT